MIKIKTNKKMKFLIIKKTRIFKMKKIYKSQMMINKMLCINF